MRQICYSIYANHMPGFDNFIQNQFSSLCIYSNDDSLVIFISSHFILHWSRNPKAYKHKTQSSNKSTLTLLFFSYRNKIYSPLVRVLAMCIRCENIPDDDEEEKKMFKTFAFNQTSCFAYIFHFFFFFFILLLATFSRLKLCMLKCASSAGYSFNEVMSKSVKINFYFLLKYVDSLNRIRRVVWHYNQQQCMRSSMRNLRQKSIN